MAIGVGGRGRVRLDRDPLGLGGRRDGRRSAVDTGFGRLDCLVEEAGWGLFLVSCDLCFFSWERWSCGLGLYTLSSAATMAAAVGALILDR